MSGIELVLAHPLLSSVVLIVLLALPWFAGIEFAAITGMASGAIIAIGLLIILGDWMILGDWKNLPTAAALILLGLLDVLYWTWVIIKGPWRINLFS